MAESLLKLIASCPRCECEEKMATVVFGDRSFITTCSSFSWAIGVDDSVNLCEPDDSNNWVFEPTEEGNSVCQSDNVPHFPIYLGVGEDGLMKAKCSRCHKNGIMFSIDTATPTTSDTEIIGNLDNVFDDFLAELLLAQESSSLVENVGFLDGETQMEPNNETSRGCEYSVGDRNKIETAIVCDCGNSEPDCFEVIADPPQLKCFNCDARYSRSDGPETNATSLATCEKCGNDVNDCFFVKRDHSGNLVSIRCLVCDTVTRFPSPPASIKHFENPVCLNRERVTGWSMMKPGDHISFQRLPSYKHHAIVTAVNPSDNTLSLIEYGSIKLQGRIQERDEVIKNFDSVYLYRYDYDPENCYEPEEVIARARSRLSERDYRFFSNNCEHFATWCKTGTAICNQVQPFLQRLLGLELTTFINQANKMLKELIEECAKTSADDVFNVIGKFPRMMKTTRMFLKVGRIGLLVLINVIVEAVMFISSYKKARREFDTGKISKEEFRKRKFELIGESIGGVLLGVACGIPSFAMLGIPLSILISIAGAVSGRCAGSLLGRKLHDYTLKKPND